MVVRIWHASATAEGARRYQEHFTGTVLPDLRRLDGFQGALLLERTGDRNTEIQVITRWRSLDEIRAFAGDDTDTAVVEPAARDALLAYDTTVTHYTVVAESPSAGP
jgi:heme-degrading monooxygenase HmoA